MATFIVVLSFAIVMGIIERVRPARDWPKVGAWWTRALLLNAFQVLIVLSTGSLWDGWMLGHRLLNADHLGLWTGGFLGYLAITFVYYWWHRWRHEVGFLWRWFHQVHHSPQRIEIITSFYKHPVEIFVNGILSSAILYLGVGLSPAPATLAVLFSGLAELVYHWNVRSPYWMGFVFQRPESHCVHHQAGVHSYNFSDLPLWDILFGTFRNPRVWKARCGFGPAREARLLDMLRGVDVNSPRAEKSIR